MARLATTREKLVASGPNPVALATPQVATSRPDCKSNVMSLFVYYGTREKRSAYACLPSFQREFAIEITRDNKTNLVFGCEIQKSKLHTQKISLEFHENKVY